MEHIHLWSRSSCWLRRRNTRRNWLVCIRSPTVTHTESSDEFGDVELIGYLGGSYDKFYGEISGVTTANDDIDFSAKAGVKFTFWVIKLEYNTKTFTGVFIQHFSMMKLNLKNIESLERLELSFMIYL